MLPIHINGEGKDRIEDLIKLIIESIFKELNKTKKGKTNIENVFTDKIKYPDTYISPDHKPNFVKAVKNNFSDFLVNIINYINDYNGIFLIIDGINGLSNTPEFTNWYKRLTETIDFSDEYLPITFTLVSHKETLNKLTQHNHSFSRIFHLIEIDCGYEKFSKKLKY